MSAEAKKMVEKLITERKLRCQCGSDMKVLDLRDPASNNALVGFYIYCPGCKRHFVEGENV